MKFDDQVVWRLAEVTPKKNNMAMENPAFEDVFPIENGVIPMSC